MRRRQRRRCLPVAGHGLPGGQRGQRRRCRPAVRSCCQLHRRDRSRAGRQCDRAGAGRRGRADAPDAGRRRAERVFGDHDAGVSGFQLDAADLAYLAEVGFVHTGECSMLEDQVAEIAAVARVSYDFSDRPWEYAAPLLRYAWMASFSASHLAPDEAADLAARAVAAGPRVVLVTEGPRGALLRVGGVVVRLPARSGEVVDTLGAGDAVIGGVLTGLLRGEEPAQALGAGLDLAARACTHHGGFGYGEPLDRRWPMALRQRVRSAG